MMTDLKLFMFAEALMVLMSSQLLSATICTCQWIEAPSMNVPRLGHASVVVNNRLYVIGGSDGKVPLDTFECFDPVLQKWGPLQKIGVGADDS